MFSRRKVYYASWPYKVQDCIILEPDDPLASGGPPPSAPPPGTWCVSENRQSAVADLEQLADHGGWIIYVELTRPIRTIDEGEVRAFAKEIKISTEVDDDENWLYYAVKNESLVERLIQVGYDAIAFTECTEDDEFCEGPGESYKHLWLLRAANACRVVRNEWIAVVED